MVRFRWVALLVLQGLMGPLAAQAAPWTPASAWAGFPLVPAVEPYGFESGPICAYHQWYCRTLEVLANLERLEAPGPAPEALAPPHWQGPSRAAGGRRSDPVRNLVVEVNRIENLDGQHVPAGTFR